MSRKYAADDANLNIGSIVTERTKKYSDINMLFAANPQTQDIYLSKDAQAVKQAVKNIVLTNFYEKPFRPRVGGNVRDLLFENITAFSIDSVKKRIELAISNNEPRARVLNINISDRPERNALLINLEFLVVETRERVEISIRLERLR